jgi:hypothetical protein
MNTGLQKKIGGKRFNVLVDNNEHKLCLLFDTFGERTTKTKHIPMIPFYEKHSWLKEFNGKFLKPTSITKEMVEFEFGNGIIDFPIEKKVLKPLFDNEKEYTIREISEIIECSHSHIKRRITEVGITPSYKNTKKNVNYKVVSGCDINAALELKPDLFKKRIKTTPRGLRASVVNKQQTIF